MATIFFALGAMAFVAGGAGADNHVTVTEYSGNFRCQVHETQPNLGYEDAGFSISAGDLAEGTYWFSSETGAEVPEGDEDADVAIEISNIETKDGEPGEKMTFDWELVTDDAGIDGIDDVLVKAGDGGNHYAYDPESLGDEGLTVPGQNAISHVEFCWDAGGGPTTTEDTTTTTEEVTTTTEEVTTTTEEVTTTTGETQATVTERQTEVGGVQITQPAPAAPAAPAVASAQLARTGNGDWLPAAGVGLIAMGVAALRLSRRPRTARVIAR